MVEPGREESQQRGNETDTSGRSRGVTVPSRVLDGGSMTYEPDGTENSWTIYRDILLLLANLFWWGVIPPILGFVIGSAIEEPAPVVIALLVGGFSFPFILESRARRIGQGLAGATQSNHRPWFYRPPRR